MGHYSEKLRGSPYSVEPCKQVRVIIDTDCAAEIDDSYAIVFALLSPKLDVCAICAEHVGLHGSEADSFAAAHELLDAMDLDGMIPVLHGRAPLRDKEDCDLSEAARFMIDEALRDDPRPLFIAGQGALTNLAAALKVCPEIQNKLTLVWNGGGAYPCGGWELNSLNDYIAANRVMDSRIPLWQIPLDVISQTEVPVMTLFRKLSCCGKVGEYLYSRTLECMARLTAVITEEMSAGMPSALVSPQLLSAYYPSGERWQLCDCGIIAKILSADPDEFEMIGAPLFDEEKGGAYLLRPENPRQIRVVKNLRQHTMLQDFFDKLLYYYG